MKTVSTRQSTITRKRSRGSKQGNTLYAVLLPLTNNFKLPLSCYLASFKHTKCLPRELLRHLLGRMKRESNNLWSLWTTLTRMVAVMTGSSKTTIGRYLSSHISAQSNSMMLVIAQQMQGDFSCRLFNAYGSRFLTNL